MNLKSGTTLQGGKYKILGVLGQGGFGITYLAYNTYLDKKIAIKEFFPKEFCGRDDTSHVTLGTQNNAETVCKLKERFLKEARNIARLDNPGIVKIHDVFQENETAYYVMDFIEGSSLAHIIKANGPLSESASVDYILKIGVALEYIHSCQMTHFDVKPANIMVRESDNEPILIDFGLSKQYDVHGDATSTIMQGISHGFSPIELYNSGSVATFSPQTDVYSLGATLFYLLTGDVPPSASQVLEEGIVLPDNISHCVSSAIKQAMCANRTERYKSIKSFCRSLMKSTGVREDLAEMDEAEKSNESGQEETEQTQFIGSTTLSIGDDSSESHNCPESEVAEQYQGEAYEVEPSKWMRFLNWICGVGNLVNVNQIPTSRKVSYLFALIVLIIAAALFPVAGLLFLVFTYKHIRTALQRLIFENYLEEWDVAAGYSKAKAITIVTLLLLIPISIGILLFSMIRSDNKKEVAEYVTTVSAGCPFNLFDVQVSSVSLVDGDVIFTCHSADSIHSNRDRMNALNIDLWKPAFIDESLPHHKIAKRNNIIFKFYNNGEEMKSITLTPKEITEYINLSDSDRGKQFITSFMELQNTYLPYDLGADVKMTRVNLWPILSSRKGEEYLKFTFTDYNNVMVRQFGDSLSYKVSQFIPWGYPYLPESVAESTAGIGYEIINGSSNNVENIIYTSDEIKQMLRQ